MARYKRRKPRRKVKCAMCSPHRNGNAKWDLPHRDRKRLVA